MDSKGDYSCEEGSINERIDNMSKNNAENNVQFTKFQTEFFNDNFTIDEYTNILGPIKDVVNTCIEDNTKYYGYNIKPLINNKNSILEFIDEYITDGNLNDVKGTVDNYISNVNSFGLRVIIRGYIYTNITEDTYKQISFGNILF